MATDANPRIAKLVLLDVGLMHASLHIDAQLVQEPDLLREHRGAVDYLITSGSRVWPVEVKAGAAGTLKSLHSFLDPHPSSPVGVQLYSGAVLREERVVHLPLYRAGAVKRMNSGLTAKK